MKLTNFSTIATIFLKSTSMNNACVIALSYTYFKFTAHYMILLI